MCDLVPIPNVFSLQIIPTCHKAIRGFLAFTQQVLDNPIAIQSTTYRVTEVQLRKILIRSYTPGSQ